MKSSLPAPMSDVALLAARVLLGVIMIAHGEVSVAKLSVVFALKTRSCAIGLCGC